MSSETVVSIPNVDINISWICGFVKKIKPDADIMLIYESDYANFRLAGGLQRNPGLYVVKVNQTAGY